MNSELKQKWLAALRSGKYKQGYRFLYNPGFLYSGVHSYCCLGLLHIIIHGKDPTEHEEYLSDIDEKTAGLTFQIQQKLGAMNDGRGSVDQHKMTFIEIADWIEENL